MRRKLLRICIDLTINKSTNFYKKHEVRIMKLILNKNPLWTQKHLAHMKKYADNYGMFFQEVDYDRQLRKIINEDADLRCNTNQACYEIFVNQEYVGDIVINSENELDIVIFDEFSHKGYAYSAISMFIDNYYSKNSRLEAVIRGENNYKDRIQSILQNIGFRCFQCCADGNEIWVYD